MEQNAQKKKNVKSKFLAGAMGVLLLGSIAKGAEKKNTIDNVVEPVQKVELAKNKNATLAGAGFSIDGFGYKSVEVNFGKFYDSGFGFLIGLGADLPANAKVAIPIQDQTYEIDSFGRKGFMISFAGLKGKPGKIAFGAKAGIGFQASQVNGATVDIGDSTIGAYLARYTPVSGTSKSSPFFKAGGLILMPVGKNLYIAFEAGAKGLVHPTERKNTYRGIEYQSRSGLYAGAGIEAKF